MINLSIKVTSRRVEQALKLAPGVMAKHMQRGIGRVGAEGAREMKRNARGSMAEGTMVNSMRSQPRGQFAVFIGPAVDYAPMVDEGTGPGGVPSIQTLKDWISVKGITPESPDVDDEDELAFLIQRKIQEEGTPAQPFVDPTHQFLRRRGPVLMRKAAARGLRELGLA
ncbi:MAG: hypothetical protein OEZ10_11520 [Gammaproteobacteria bacterium]|nr:hypothetical protein [Gammaproteobacteria bacterium]